MNKKQYRRNVWEAKKRLSMLQKVIDSLYEKLVKWGDLYQRMHKSFPPEIDYVEGESYEEMSRRILQGTIKVKEIADTLYLLGKPVMADQLIEIYRKLVEKDNPEKAMINKERYYALKKQHKKALKENDYANMIMVGSKEYTQMRKYEMEYICEHSIIESLQGGQLEVCKNCGKSWGM